VTPKAFPKLDNLKVKVSFPNRESEIVSFQGLRQYALGIKDLAMCSELMTFGMYQKGSLRYTLINAD